MGNKRQRERMPKEERRNLRLWADGARETILAPHLDNFTAARTKGSRTEKAYLQTVCNEFHAHVDWRLADHEEPELKPWTPETIVAKETLSDDEEKLKRARIELLNARIYRWYTYRARRLLKHRRSGLDPSKDPYAVLLGKLSGLSTPPKARQAYQQFMRESYTEKIAPAVARGWEQEREKNPGTLGMEPKAGFRAQIARKVFAALSDTERAGFATRAKDEAVKAKADYMAALKKPASTAPADRQKCIDAAGDFLAPILRGLEECTGLHLLVLMGGPMPKYGGELRTSHVSYGRSGTAAAPHFPQWDKARFSENVVKFMIEYLHTAFTKEECAAAALPDVLAQAKYTFEKGADADTANNTEDAEDSDSSDSESDSDEDSASDSDEDARPRKKSKVTVKYTAAAKKPSKASTGKRQRASRAAAAPVEGAAVPDGATFAAPTSPNPSSRSPSPPPAPTYTQQRDINIKRLEEETRALREKLTAALGEMIPAQPKSVRKKKTKVPPGQATRKSSRVAALGDLPPPVVATVATTVTIPVIPVIPVVPTVDPPIPDPVVPLIVPAVEAVVQPVVPVTPSTGEPPAHTVQTMADNAVSNHPAPAALALSDVHMTTVPPPATSTSQPEPCPAKAPDWFRDARAELTRIDLGIHFHAVLNAWTRIEAASRFEHAPTNLPHRLRPVQVGRWIGGQRGKRIVDTSVPDPTAYATEWEVWWETLQPHWRVKGPDGKWVVGGVYGTDWGVLFQWGVNGILSVLAALYFWGCAVIDAPDADLTRAWEAEVQDVSWVLEGLALFYEKDWRF